MRFEYSNSSYDFLENSTINIVPNNTNNYINFTITPNLPGELNIDNNTGIISGRATIPIYNTKFTISATESDIEHTVEIYLAITNAQVNTLDVTICAENYYKDLVIPGKKLMSYVHTSIYDNYVNDSSEPKGVSSCISKDNKYAYIGLPHISKVLLFQNINNSWTIKDILQPDGISHTNSLFGWAVCCTKDGKTAFISAPYLAGSSVGNIWKYSVNDTTWTAILGETPSSDNYEYPGTFMDCDDMGDLLVYTKKLDSSSEFLIVPPNNKTTIPKSGTVKIPGDSADKDLGEIKVFVGDYNDANNKGKLFLYSYDGTEISDFAQGLDINSYSGYSMDISQDGSRVAVGERDRVSVWELNESNTYTQVGKNNTIGWKYYEDVEAASIINMNTPDYPIPALAQELFNMLSTQNWHGGGNRPDDNSSYELILYGYLIWDSVDNKLIFTPTNGTSDIRNVRLIFYSNYIIEISDISSRWGIGFSDDAALQARTDIQAAIDYNNTNMKVLFKYDNAGINAEFNNTNSGLTLDTNYTGLHTSGYKLSLTGRSGPGGDPGGSVWVTSYTYTTFGYTMDDSVHYFNNVINRGADDEKSEAYPKIITKNTILSSSPLNTLSISGDGNKVLCNLYQTKDSLNINEGLSLWQYGVHKNKFLLVHQAFTSYDMESNQITSNSRYAGVSLSSDASLMLSVYPYFTQSKYTQVTITESHKEMLFPNQCTLDSDGKVLTIPNYETVPEGAYVKTVTQTDWVDYKLKVNSDIPEIESKGKILLLQGKKHYYRTKEYILSKGGYIDGYTIDSSTPLPTGISLNELTGIISGVPDISVSIEDDVICKLTVSNFTGSDTIDITFDLALGPPKLVTISDPIEFFEESSVIMPLIDYGTFNLGGEIYEFSSSNLPKGLSIESASGNITGTPSFGTAGTHYVKILGKNNYGETEAILELAVHKNVPQISLDGNVQMGYNIKDVLSLDDYAINLGGKPTDTQLASGSLEVISLKLDNKNGDIYGMPNNGTNEQNFEEKIELTFSNSYKLLQYPNKIMNIGGYTTTIVGSPKILCLHDGDQSAEQFKGSRGVVDLIAACSPFEFVFAQAPYDGNLWIKEPPGGEDVPTTEEDWASEAIESIDKIIEEKGPFLGVLGFSQGAAFISVYLSNKPNNFNFVVMFSGYIPTLHTGLVEKIAQNSPFNTQSLSWMGANDSIIANSLGENQSTLFSKSEVIVSKYGMHNVPNRYDQTFKDVVYFINSKVNETAIVSATGSQTNTTNPFNGKSFAINYDGTYAALTQDHVTGTLVETSLGYIPSVPHGSTHNDGAIGTVANSSNNYRGDADINVRHLVGIGNASNSWNSNNGFQLSNTHNNGAYSPSRNKFYTGIYSSDTSPYHKIIEVDPTNPSNSSNSRILAYENNSYIYGLIIDNQDKYLYYCGHSCIKRIDLSNPGTPGVIAGSDGSSGNTPSSIDDPIDALNARFSNPRGLAISHDDTYLYISEHSNNAICELNLSTMKVRKFFLGSPTKYPVSMCYKKTSDNTGELFYNDNWGHGSNNGDANSLGYIYRSIIVSSDSGFKLVNPDSTPVNSDPNFAKRIAGKGTYSTPSTDGYGRSNNIQYVLSMVVSPDGNTLYFCEHYSNNTGENRVRQIDLSDNNYPVTSLTSGFYPNSNNYHNTTSYSSYNYSTMSSSGTGFSSYIFYANGIAITPDGKKLYVVGYSDVYELDLDPDDTKQELTHIVDTQVVTKQIGFYNYTDNNGWQKESGNLSGNPEFMEMTQSGDYLATYEPNEVKTFVKNSDAWETNGNIAIGSPAVSMSLNGGGNVLAIGMDGSVDVYKQIDSTWQNYGKTLSHSNKFGQSVKISADGKRLAVTANKYAVNNSQNGIANVFEINDGEYEPFTVKVADWSDGDPLGNVYNFMGPFKESKYSNLQTDYKTYGVNGDQQLGTQVSYYATNWYDSRFYTDFKSLLNSTSSGAMPGGEHYAAGEGDLPYVVLQIADAHLGNSIGGINITSPNTIGVSGETIDITNLSKLEDFDIYSSDDLSNLVGDISNISSDLLVHSSETIHSTDSGLLYFNLKSTEHKFYRVQAKKVSSPDKFEIFHIELYGKNAVSSDKYTWKPIADPVQNSSNMDFVNIDINSSADNMFLSIPSNNQILNYSLSENKPYSWELNPNGNVTGTGNLGQSISIDNSLNTMTVSVPDDSSVDVYKYSNNSWGKWGKSLKIDGNLTAMNTVISGDGKRFIAGSPDVSEAYIYQLAETKPFPVDGIYKEDMVISLPKSNDLVGLSIVDNVQNQAESVEFFIKVKDSKPNFAGLEKLLYPSQFDVGTIDLQEYNVQGNATKFEIIGLSSELSMSNMGIITGKTGDEEVLDITLFAENSAGNTTHQFKIDAVAPPNIVPKDATIAIGYYNKIGFDDYAVNNGGEIETLQLSKIIAKPLGNVVDAHSNITYQAGSGVVTFNDESVKIIKYDDTGTHAEDIEFEESPFALNTPTDIYVSSDSDKLAAVYINNTVGNVVFYDRNGVDNKYYKMDFNEFENMANVINVSFSDDLMSIQIDHEETANIAKLNLINNKYHIDPTNSISLLKDVQMSPDGNELIDYGEQSFEYEVGYDLPYISSVPHGNAEGGIGVYNSTNSSIERGDGKSQDEYLEGDSRIDVRKLIGNQYGHYLYNTSSYHSPNYGQWYTAVTSTNPTPSITNQGNSYFLDKYNRIYYTGGYNGSGYYGVICYDHTNYKYKFVNFSTLSNSYHYFCIAVTKNQDYIYTYNGSTYQIHRWQIDSSGDIVNSSPRLICGSGSSGTSNPAASQLGQSSSAGAGNSTNITTMYNMNLTNNGRYLYTSDGNHLTEIDLGYTYGDPEYATIQASGVKLRRASTATKANAASHHTMHETSEGEIHFYIGGSSNPGRGHITYCKVKSQGDDGFIIEDLRYIAGTNGESTYDDYDRASKVDGPGLQIKLNYVYGLHVSIDGKTLYFGDSHGSNRYNNRVRQLDLTSSDYMVTTLTSGNYDSKNYSQYTNSYTYGSRTTSTYLNQSSAPFTGQTAYLSMMYVSPTSSPDGRKLYVASYAGLYELDLDPSGTRPMASTKDTISGSSDLRLWNYNESDKWHNMGNLQSSTVLSAFSNISINNIINYRFNYSNDGHLIVNNDSTHVYMHQECPGQSMYGSPEKLNTAELVSEEVTDINISNSCGYLTLIAGNKITSYQISVRKNLPIRIYQDYSIVGKLNEVKHFDIVAQNRGGKQRVNIQISPVIMEEPTEPISAEHIVDETSAMIQFKYPDPSHIIFYVLMLNSSTMPDNESIKNASPNSDVIKYGKLYPEQDVNYIKFGDLSANIYKVGMVVENTTFNVLSAVRDITFTVGTPLVEITEIENEVDNVAVINTETTDEIMAEIVDQIKDNNDEIVGTQEQQDSKRRHNRRRFRNAFRAVFNRRRSALTHKKRHAVRYTKTKLKEFNDTIDDIPDIQDTIRVLEPRKDNQNQNMGMVDFRKRSIYIPHSINDENSIIKDKTSTNIFEISSFMDNDGKEKFNITEPGTENTIISIIPKRGVNRRSIVTFADNNIYKVGDYLTLVVANDINYNKKRIKVTNISDDSLTDKQVLVDNYIMIENGCTCNKLLPGLIGNDEEMGTFTHAYIKNGVTHLNSFNWSSITMTGGDTDINHIGSKNFPDYNPIYGTDSSKSYPYKFLRIKDNKSLPNGIKFEDGILKKDTGVSEITPVNDTFVFVGKLDEEGSEEVEFPIKINIWDNLTKMMGTPQKSKSNKGLKLEYKPEIKNGNDEILLEESVLVTVDSDRSLSEMSYSLGATDGNIDTAVDKTSLKHENKLIDEWLSANSATLNEFGDINDAVYVGGSPLFNESNEEVTDLYDYVRGNHENKPWIIDYGMEDTLIKVWLRNKIDSGEIDSTGVTDIEYIKNHTDYKQKPWFSHSKPFKYQYHIPISFANSNNSQQISDCISIQTKDEFGSEYKTNKDNCFIYAFDKTTPTGNVKQLTLHANSGIDGIAPKIGKKYSIELGMNEVGNVHSRVHDIHEGSDIELYNKVKELELEDGNIATLNFEIDIDTLPNRELELISTYTDRASTNSNVIIDDNVSELKSKFTTYPEPIVYKKFLIDNADNGNIAGNLENHESVAQPFVLNIKQYQDINFSISEQIHGNLHNMTYSNKDWSDIDVNDWATDVIGNKYNGVISFDNSKGNLDGYFNRVGEYAPSFAVKNVYDKEMVSRISIKVHPAKPIIEKYNQGIDTNHIKLDIDADDKTRYSLCNNLNCGVDNITNSDLSGDSIWAGNVNGDNMWGIFEIGDVVSDKNPISAVRLITKHGSDTGNITSFDVYASDHINELKPEILPEDLLIHRNPYMPFDDTGIERVNKDITKSKYFKLQITGADTVAQQKIISFQIFTEKELSLNKIRMNTDTEFIPTIRKTDTNGRERRSGTSKYYANSLPDGLQIDDSTGIISGNPTTWIPKQKFNIYSENSSGNITKPVEMNFTHFTEEMESQFLEDGKIPDTKLDKALGNLISTNLDSLDANEKRQRLRNYTREIFGISGNVDKKQFIIENINQRFKHFVGDLDNMRDKFKVIRPVKKSEPKPDTIPVVNYLDNARQSAYIPFDKEEYGYIKDEIDNKEYRFGKNSDDTFTLEVGNVSDQGFTQIDLGELNQEGDTFMYTFTADNGKKYGRNFTWGSVITSGFSEPSTPGDFKLTYSHNESVGQWDPSNGNVAVTWQSQEEFNNGDAITKYILYRKNTLTEEIVNWEIDDLAVQFDDTGLHNGQVYAYTLTPYNSVGEGNSAETTIEIEDKIPPRKPELQETVLDPPEPLNTVPAEIKFKGENNCIPTVTLNDIEYGHGNITVNEIAIDGDTGNSIYTIVPTTKLPPWEEDTMSDGIQAYTITLTDQHTNTSEVSDPYLFRYDITPPNQPELDSYHVTFRNEVPDWFKFTGEKDCDIILYLGDDMYSETDFTVTDLGGDDTGNLYQVEIKNKALGPSGTIISDGTISFKISLTDLANNTSSNSIAHTFLYDITKPNRVENFDTSEDHENAVVSKYFSRPEYNVKFTAENVAIEDVTVYQLHHNQDGSSLVEFQNGYNILQHSDLEAQQGNINKVSGTEDGELVQYLFVPPTTLNDGSEIPDGNITYMFDLRDSANNFSGNSVEYTFVVVNDSIPPEIPIINSSEISTVLGNTISYNHPSWTGKIDFEGESNALLDVFHKLNTGSWLKEDTPSYSETPVDLEGTLTGTSDYNYNIKPDLVNGTHRYMFRLTDDAKNVGGNSAVYQFNMHKTKPEMLNVFGHDNDLITTPIQSGNTGLPEILTFDVQKSLEHANIINVRIYDNETLIGNLTPTENDSVFTHGNVDAEGNIVGSNILQKPVDQSGEVTLYVSVVGGKYKFWDDESLSSPLVNDIKFTSGITYTFDQSDESNDNHPLAFSDIYNLENIPDDINTESNGTAGEEGAYEKYKFKSDVSPVYIYCKNHGHRMGYESGHEIIISDLAVQYSFVIPRYLSEGGNVEDKLYKYRFRAIDNLYNVSEFSEPYQFTIDNTQPDKPSVLFYETYLDGNIMNPNEDTDLGNVNYNPTFVISGITDNATNPVIASRAGDDDNYQIISGNTICPSNSTTMYCFNTPSLAEGVNKFKFQLIDKATNISEYSNIIQFNYDKTLPSVPVISTQVQDTPINNGNITNIEMTGPYARRLRVYKKYSSHSAGDTSNNTDYIEQISPSVLITANENTTGDNDAYKYVFTPVTPVGDGSGDGNITYKYFLEDHANNISGNTEPYRLIVDNTPPVIELKPHDNLIDKYKRYVEDGLTITDNVSHIDGSLDSRVVKKYYFDNDDSTKYEIPYPLDISNQSDANYIEIIDAMKLTIEYIVTDIANNVSSVIERIMLISDPPPSEQEINIKNKVWIALSFSTKAIGQDSIKVTDFIQLFKDAGIAIPKYIYGRKETSNGYMKPVYYHTYKDSGIDRAFGELDELDIRFGYHIYVEDEDTDKSKGDSLGVITLVGEQPRATTIPIYKDMWQLIGFPGDYENGNVEVSNIFSNIHEATDDYESKPVTNMELNKAYWVYHDKDVKLTIDNTRVNNKVFITEEEQVPTIANDRGNIIAIIPGYDSSSPPGKGTYVDGSDNALPEIMGYQVPILIDVNIDAQNGNVTDKLLINKDDKLIFNSNSLIEVGHSDENYPHWARGNVVATGVLYTKTGEITSGYVFKEDTNELLDLKSIYISDNENKLSDNTLRSYPNQLVRTVTQPTTLTDPVRIEAITSIDQTIPFEANKWRTVHIFVKDLPKEWIMTSPFMGPQVQYKNSSLKALFNNYPDQEISVYNTKTLSRSDSTQSIHFLWYVIDFNSSDLYWMKTNQNTSLQLTGKPVDSVTYTISANGNGWNLITYPLQATKSVEEFLGDLIEDDNKTTYQIELYRIGDFARFYAIYHNDPDMGFFNDFFKVIATMSVEKPQAWGPSTYPHGRYWIKTSKTFTLTIE